MFPSCAVTTIFIVLLPTLNEILPEALPLETVVPFTLTVAFAWLTVGVTVTVVFALDTLVVE